MQTNQGRHFFSPSHHPEDIVYGSQKRRYYPWKQDFAGPLRWTKTQNSRQEEVLPQHLSQMLPAQSRYSPGDSFHTNPLMHLAYAKQSRPFSYYAFMTLSWIIFAFTLPFSLFFCIKIVHEYKRMVVFRLGRLKSSKPMGPGIVLTLPCIDEHHMIDLRTMSYDVPSQEMLTKDSVTVSVDAAVYYRTSDPIASAIFIADAHLSTKQLAQSTLRNVLGTRTLSEIMCERESIALQAQEVLDEGTDPWGIKVERVEVKDIRLPQNLTRAMAREAEASREADAKVVSASGELNASHALSQAADRFGSSSTAIQLRYLQTLTRISTSQNHTIVIPFPIELLKKLISHPTVKSKTGSH